MKRMLAILTAASASLFAQDWAREAQALRPPQSTGQDKAFLDALEDRARSALAAIAHARTPEEAATARPELRRRLEQALGLKKMPWPPKLNGRVTGTVRREGYRIEKVVYEALPG